MPVALVGPLADAVEQHIVDSQAEFHALLTGSEASPPHAGSFLAAKYVPTARATQYRHVNAGLFIGDAGFTWGSGVYVTPITSPASTAIYGRAGIVARYDPTGWRTYDARAGAGLTLYLDWLRLQPDYVEAVTTVHSNHWLHQMRNAFREQFHIDCVFFDPDEWDEPRWYAVPGTVWLAVSDWTAPGLLARGFSNRFHEARLVLLAEEEFVTQPPGLIRAPLLAVRGDAALPVPTANDVRNAYEVPTIIRVPS